MFLLPQTSMFNTMGPRVREPALASAFASARTTPRVIRRLTREWEGKKTITTRAEIQYRICGSRERNGAIFAHLYVFIYFTLFIRGLDLTFFSPAHHNF